MNCFSPAPTGPRPIPSCAAPQTTRRGFQATAEQEKMPSRKKTESELASLNLPKDLSPLPSARAERQGVGHVHLLSVEDRICKTGSVWDPNGIVSRSSRSLNLTNVHCKVVNGMRTRSRGVRVQHPRPAAHSSSTTAVSSRLRLPPVTISPVVPSTVTRSHRHRHGR